MPSGMAPATSRGSRNVWRAPSSWSLSTGRLPPNVYLFRRGRAPRARSSGGGAAGHRGPFFVSATRFTYRHTWHMPLVFWHGPRLRRAWPTIDGAVGLSIMADLRERTTYTLSLWRSVEDLRRWSARPIMPLSCAATGPGWRAPPPMGGRRIPSISRQRGARPSSASADSPPAIVSARKRRPAVGHGPKWRDPVSGGSSHRRSMPQPSRGW